MPIVNVKVIEGVFTAEQKAQMIHKLTEAMVEVEGEGMRDLTYVVIDEVKPGDWAIGGRPVSPKPQPKSN
ncbi:tautomerase family protein [Streptomyces sp. NPDC001732]